MAKSIFRQKALEQLASPDNLHELVQVTSSRSWLALLAWSILILVLLIWSIFGSLPKTAKGKGILIQSGGLAEVTLLGSGIVQQILVKDGDFVHKNDTIAIVAQPELQIQIENEEEKLKFLKKKRLKLVRFNIKSEIIRANFEKKYSIEEQLIDSDRQVRALEETLNNQEELANQNMIPKEQINQTRLKFVRLQRNKLILENELKKLNLITGNQNFAQSAELESLEAEMRESKRNLDEMNVKFTLSAYVRSPYEGKVIELMTKKGQLISLGAPVVSIEISNEASADLEAIIYLSPDEGKKIIKGMQARIAPATVKTEEHGYMEGIVTKVSEYPSTKQGMASVLGNADLVENFSKDELPISVFIKLQKAKTKSGFRWTSSAGPDLEIHAGTLCEANIVIQMQSPIHLLLPF